jgi:hypothetical protein
MLNRRRLLELAAASITCAVTGRPLGAQQASTTTVTLTIEGMT